MVGGYARGKKSNGKPRNYSLESKRNVLKQVYGLKGLSIQNHDYLDLEIPDKSFIYCDPPYSESICPYSNTKFNSVIFWDWALSKFKEGHTVFVSEYKKPEFIQADLVWAKEVNNTLDKNTGNKKGVEKLYRIR